MNMKCLTCIQGFNQSTFDNIDIIDLTKLEQAILNFFLSVQILDVIVIFSTRD